MKKSEKKAYFIVGIIAVSLMLILSLHIYNPIHPDFDPFPTGSYKFKDAEKELEISITCDGEYQTPYGTLKYLGKEYAIEINEKGGSTFVYLKGENDSDFSFSIVGNYKIKSNGNVVIKRIEFLENSPIDFGANRIILKKEK